LTDTTSTASGTVTAANDTSLTAFFKDMSVQEKRTFWGCWAGWSLDGMDFMIYPLVLGTVIALWDVDRGTAGIVTTLTILTSSVGGWLGGYMADRFGRVRMLKLTILWFSFFSALCAFTQDFTQLAITRAILGFGFGAEWSAGAILVGETVKAQYRGRAVGTVQSGWAIGWGLAVIAQAAVYSLAAPELAWRIMFVLGALPALLVFYLRRYVEEPEVSVKAMQTTPVGERASIFEIFKGGYLKTTLVAAIMTSGATGGYYAINTWLPTYLTTVRQMTVVASTGYLVFLIVGAFLGFVFGAWFADRFGRRKLFLFFSVSAAILVVVYIQAPLPNSAMFLLGLPVGFFSTGHFSGLGPILTELYPTRLRGSGQGFCYNFGRGLGAFIPAFVGYLSLYLPLGDAMSLFAVISYGIFFVFALMLPETKGKELEAN
jgi:MFS family permease